ncbi:hypothetical protein BDK51DRAFT_48406 [Blyttiomyces helicus]|uniref:Uncharacterized protein n=1 Tax=Blyttiomyces helicus TaxID=388810 RepID=A0A4P9W4X6_9FUNG|nr:hypothetical protein BDK51DRAFT_48406 [Blyttiomyces helicus]|eukprot:RKO85780.1 hypothetical protein BDK51DRAFT_48406 [Blyttiomyces helicus]
MPSKVKTDRRRSEVETLVRGRPASSLSPCPLYQTSKTNTSSSLPPTSLNAMNMSKPCSIPNQPVSLLRHRTGHSSSSSLAGVAPIADVPHEVEPPRTVRAKPAIQPQFFAAIFLLFIQTHLICLLRFLLDFVIVAIESWCVHCSVCYPRFYVVGTTGSSIADLWDALDGTGAMSAWKAEVMDAVDAAVVLEADCSKSPPPLPLRRPLALSWGAEVVDPVIEEQDEILPGYVGMAITPVGVVWNVAEATHRSVLRALAEVEDARREDPLPAPIETLLRPIDVTCPARTGVPFHDLYTYDSLSPLLAPITTTIPISAVICRSCAVNVTADAIVAALPRWVRRKTRT